MSEQPPNRSLRLRHRVVGAAVLAALIAIFIPAVLDFDPRTTETRITRTHIPERPADLRVEEIPLVAPDAAPAVRKPAEPTEETKAEPPVTASPEPGAVDAVPAPAPSAATAAAASAPRAWVVRVGSFSSNDNAVALRDRVRAAGFDAFIDEATVDGATMFRVHVGPEIDRARGDALRERLTRELKLDGLVVGYE
jgi:DedD protein